MRNYWWPGISKYVLNYVDGCDVCQRGKAFPEMPAGKLFQMCLGQIFPWILLQDYQKLKVTTQYLLYVIDSQNKSILFLL